MNFGGWTGPWFAFRMAESPDVTERIQFPVAGCLPSCSCFAKNGAVGSLSRWLVLRGDLLLTACFWEQPFDLSPFQMLYEGSDPSQLRMSHVHSSLSIYQVRHHPNSHCLLSTYSAVLGRGGLWVIPALSTVSWEKEGEGTHLGGLSSCFLLSWKQYKVWKIQEKYEEEKSRHLCTTQGPVFHCRASDLKNGFPTRPWRAGLIRALRTQRQTDLHKFKAILVYKSEFQPGLHRETLSRKTGLGQGRKKASKPADPELCLVPGALRCCLLGERKSVSGKTGVLLGCLSSTDIREQAQTEQDWP